MNDDRLQYEPHANYFPECFDSGLESPVLNENGNIDSDWAFFVDNPDFLLVSSTDEPLFDYKLEDPRNIIGPSDSALIQELSL